MYHIVICDDEPIFLTQISEMIIDILASMGESCEIRKYTSISELKNTLQNTPKSCDILILDIMLGENNGISFAECLRDTENQIPVIFISSSKEFVFDAYSAEPVGYILKPVSRQKLAEALTRAIRHLIPKSIIIVTSSQEPSQPAADSGEHHLNGRPEFFHVVCPPLKFENEYEKRHSAERLDSEKYSLCYCGQRHRVPRRPCAAIVSPNIHP